MKITPACKEELARRGVGVEPKPKPKPKPKAKKKFLGGKK